MHFILLPLSLIIIIFSFSRISMLLYQQNKNVFFVSVAIIFFTGFLIYRNQSIRKTDVQQISSKHNEKKPDFVMPKPTREIKDIKPAAVQMSIEATPLNTAYISANRIEITTDQVNVNSSDNNATIGSSSHQLTSAPNAMVPPETDFFPETPVPL